MRYVPRAEKKVEKMLGKIKNEEIEKHRKKWRERLLKWLEEEKEMILERLHFRNGWKIEMRTI